MQKKYTTKEWVKLAKQKWKSKFDLTRVVYDGIRKKVIIDCKDHGWVTVDPENFLNHSKWGGPKCGR